MNSGIAPQLLQKNQFAFALNNSIRGGFIKCRPPIGQKTLNFSGNLELQALLTTGLFQGAGYYRPDFGTESLIAQISGRLLLFTETGTTWFVKEISIPGDLNDPTVNQVWMWQSERWMIIQDGSGALPIFFDGTSSRRSFGPAQTIGVSASGVVVPPLGQFVKVPTISIASQTADLVIFNGEYYAVTGLDNEDGYFSGNLKTVFKPTQNIIPSGTPVFAIPPAVGNASRVVTSNIVGQVKVNAPSTVDVTVGNASVRTIFFRNIGLPDNHTYDSVSGVPIPITQPGVIAVAPYKLSAGTMLDLSANRLHWNEDDHKKCQFKLEGVHGFG